LAHNDRYVVIAVVMVNNPKLLNHAVKRARQRTPKYSKATSYLHATKDALAVTTALLTQLSDIQIGLTIFDKEWWWRQDLSPDAVYDLLLSYALETAITIGILDQRPIQIVIEGRYKGAQRQRLVTTSPTTWAWISIKCILQAKLTLSGDPRCRWPTPLPGVGIKR
jgi:hypothetical protein